MGQREFYHRATWVFDRVLQEEVEYRKRNKQEEAEEGRAATGCRVGR